MKVTNIEVQKKNKERVSIFIDGNYGFSLHTELVYKYHIKVGMDLEPSFINEIAKVEEQKKQIITH